jgi:hypothetical protein
MADAAFSGLAKASGPAALSAAVALADFSVGAALAIAISAVPTRHNAPYVLRFANLVTILLLPSARLLRIISVVRHHAHHRHAHHRHARHYSTRRGCSRSLHAIR